MKHKKGLKKIMCLMLAVMLVLGMSMMVMAAPDSDNITVTVTVPDTGSLVDGHQFTAYQIFKGTQGDENILGDIGWGDGINSTAFVTALKGSNKLGDSNPFNDTSVKNGTAAEVAKILPALTPAQLNEVAKIAFDNKTGNGTVLSTGANEMPAGYYLIVDTTSDVGEDGVYNAALLQATQNVTIQVKTDKPSTEKKVKEGDYSVDGDTAKYGEGFNDVADYSIGDTVPFAFYSKVPDMTYYSTYKYIFHDKMDAGLTFDKNSVKVTIGSSEVTTGYSVKTENLGDDCTFEVVFDDLKKIDAATKGADIRITFNATLNKNAVVGNPGNVNDMQLEFSNNPNDENETGKTPHDKVVVFTYELDVTKVDGTDATKKLKDAEFILYRKMGSNVEYAVVDGDGKLIKWDPDKDNATTLKSDEDGNFKVIGLEDGVYYLEETKAPAGGYNTLTDPVIVTITATTNNGQTVDITTALTKLEVKTKDGENGTESAAKEGSIENGNVAITVENNKGTTLPETGGIGTTVFYILGGILVLGCGAILVTRKRMYKR